MKEMTLRMSLVGSSKNSIGFAQMKLAKKFMRPSNLNVMIVNQKWWKTFNQVLKTFSKRNTFDEK